MYPDNVGIYSRLDAVSARARQSGRECTRSWIINCVLFLRAVGYTACYPTNGDKFTGTYTENMKNGEGSYEWASGDSYTGSYVNDVREGYGTYTWANGESYTGEWKDNYMNGEGTFTWPSGRVYTGHFENGVIVRTEDSAPESGDAEVSAPIEG